MTLAPAAADLGALLQLPFLQRALLAGLLSGTLGGLMGSLAVLRQLSFFSDALGHSALLGLALGLALGINPTLVLIPFAVLFALGVNQLVRSSRLPADSLLNILYSSSLALAVLVLSLLRTPPRGLQQLLFGDILGVGWADLLQLAMVLLAALAYLMISRRGQILLSLDEPLAITRGVAAGSHRVAFLVLLAVVVAVAIQAVGVLLISAFLVIPASSARLLARGFNGYLLLAMGLGGAGATAGLLLATVADLPAGPAVVVLQLGLFMLALALAPLGRQASIG
ncbi:MAG: metal ABC transporter permease [Cyanobacteriota bacterium]|jgi:zinc/manganese transport system permease protein|nr:metal ABC transporter permease [Cyanobacteriota bacterium]